MWKQKFCVMILMMTYCLYPCFAWGNSTAPDFLREKSGWTLTPSAGERDVDSSSRETRVYFSSSPFLNKGLGLLLGEWIDLSDVQHLVIPDYSAPKAPLSEVYAVFLTAPSEKQAFVAPLMQNLLELKNNLGKGILLYLYAFYFADEHTAEVQDALSQVYQLAWMISASLANYPIDSQQRPLRASLMTQILNRKSLSQWRDFVDLFQKLEQKGRGALFETRPLFLLDSGLWPEASDSIEFPTRIPYVRTGTNGEKMANLRDNKTLKLIVQAKRKRGPNIVIDLEGKIQGHDVEKQQIILEWWAPFLIGEKIPDNLGRFPFVPFVQFASFSLNCPSDMHCYILGMPYLIFASEL